MKKLVKLFIDYPFAILNWFLDLLFPCLCVQCGTEGEYLCSSCSNELISQNIKQVCLVCTKNSQNGETHPECLPNHPLNGFFHATTFDNNVSKQLVHNLKYNGVQGISIVLSNIIYHKITISNTRDLFNNYIIIPVPSHKKRKKERGYNQTELIAENLAVQLGLSYQPQLLKKIKHSKAQATLNKKARQENLQGAFEALPDVANNKIILIDDVATTGATLTQAALALKTAQAISVWAVTFAYEV